MKKTMRIDELDSHLSIEETAAATPAAVALPAKAPIEPTNEEGGTPSVTHQQAKESHQAHLSKAKINLEKDVMSLCEHDEVFCSLEVDRPRHADTQTASNAAAVPMTATQSIDLQAEKIEVVEEIDEDRSHQVCKRIKTHHSSCIDKKQKQYRRALLTNKAPGKFMSVKEECNNDYTVIYKPTCDDTTKLRQVTKQNKTIKLGRYQGSEADVTPTTFSSNAAPSTSSSHPLSFAPMIKNKERSSNVVVNSDKNSNKEGVSSNALVRLLVHKPMAVARALRNEVWETFTPGSQ